MTAPRWFLPERVLIDGDLVAGLAVAIDEASGRIVAVQSPPDGADVLALPRQALLPGFVNAHSHAFQRALRGRTEHLRADRPDEDFWSWRELMYDLALSLDPDRMYQIATGLYRELRAAGYTAVGEFHYLHHQATGAPFDDPVRMARQCIDAALDAGLRITLLLALYHTSAIGQPATDAQRRFVVPDLPPWFAMVDALLADYGDHPRVNIGLAPHSIRAVPYAWLQQLAAFNRTRHLPVHMHLCEQTAEIDQCVRAFGKAPIAVVHDAGLLDAHLTAVHATWLAPDDPQRLADAGATVCACPTTEANLGDGVLPALALLSAGVPLCIGSDSHITVNPFEELRLIENNERLRLRRRNVLAGLAQPHTAADTLRLAPGLLEIGARHGARALGLGLDAGTIAPGQLADLVAVNLDDHALRDVPPEALPEALVFSADTRCVTHTIVHGQLA